jgi:hypothetical protein
MESNFVLSFTVALDQHKYCSPIAVVKLGYNRVYISKSFAVANDSS